MMDSEKRFDVQKTLRLTVPAALCGWLGVGVGLNIAPQATYFGYLVAFAVTVATVLGALMFSMITHVVDASWHVVIRPLNEAVVRVVPLLPLLFLPLCFGLRELYPWARPALELDAHELSLLHHKQAYLNPAFFFARSALYFAIWIAAALLLTRRLRNAQAELGAQRGWAAALLPPTAVSLTFAAFDWLMSLDPFWSSSIFGVYYFAGGFVANFGLLALLARRSFRAGALKDVLRPPHFHALGRLMLGFSIFWAYIAFFQALLIRMANRPDEVSFYVRRLTGGWEVLLWLTVALRFVLPFLLLLPRRPKFRPGFVAVCGGMILLGQLLDMFWLVAPQRDAGTPLPGVWDLAGLLAVVGSAATFGALRLRRVPAVALDHPYWERSLAYRSVQ